MIGIQHMYGLSHINFFQVYSYKVTSFNDIHHLNNIWIYSITYVHAAENKFGIEKLQKAMYTWFVHDSYVNLPLLGIAIAMYSKTANPKRIPFFS